MGEAYVHLSRRGATLDVHGAPSCTLGDPLPSSRGENPEGIYAQWSWDGRRLCVRNDRYGMYPLYYFAARDVIAVSPSLPMLLELGAPTELDDAALAVFARVGFFLAEDTPFRHVRALPPDARLEWTDGRLTVDGSRVVARAQPLARADAIDGYIQLFRAAVARRPAPPEEVAVPLSGGRDSRHILLELCAADRPPAFCVTMRHYPPLSDEDAEIAAEIARALGVPHVVLPQPASRLAAELAKNRLTGFCADEHAWLLPLAGYLAGRARFVFDGLGGDVLSAGLFLDEERLALQQSGRHEDLAVQLCAVPEAALDRLLAPEFRARFGRGLAVARLTEELRRHDDAPNPIGSFFFWNRTRREIALAPYRILGQSVGVLSPYLDHDLYDLLASLPAAMLLDRQFHTDTIRRAFPRHRHIPFETKAVAAPESPAYWRRLTCDVARYALRVGWRRPRAIVHRAIALRAVRSLLAGDGARVDWLAPILAIYLLQLGHEGRAGCRP